MEHIAAAIQKLYQNDPEVIYQDSVYLSCINDTIRRENLRNMVIKRDMQNIFVAKIDQISERLALVQTEYRDGSDYYSEAVGLIRCNKNWQVLCVLSTPPQCRFEFLYNQDSQKQLDNLGKIGSILLRYCDDVYQMNAEDCLQLFWSQARMYHPNEDQTFSDVPIQVLRSRWRDMPDAKLSGAENFSRIYDIELLDDKTALAKIGCAKLDNYFKDYLFLMQLQNQWIIVNKMTHALYKGKRI